MKITENNCEEYFLLYIDDELNSMERSAVAAFVAKHPQYAALLEGLQQAKLSTTESIDFTHKDLLYKTEESEIGIDNYEAYFLLYTDNELNEIEMANTERFVLQHPQLQSEFTLLQQTKLPLEKIEFKGKENLYKKEKERRLIPFYISRIAVAAVVLMLVALGWQFASQHHNETATLIHLNPEKKTPSQKVEPADESKKTSLKKNDLQLSVAQQKETIRPADKPDSTTIVTVKNREPQNRKKEALPQVEIDKIPSQMNASVTPEPNELALQKQPAAVANKQAETLKPLEEVDAGESDATNAAELLVNDNNIVQPAVYKELNTEEEKGTLYVGAFQLNKAKVNGFFKSATHLLRNRSKTTTE